MGSRIVLPVLAVALLLAGIFTWFFASGEAGEAVKPDLMAAPATEVAPAVPEVLMPSSEMVPEKVPNRRVESVPEPSKVASTKKSSADSEPRVIGRLVDKLGNPILTGVVSLARPLTFGFGSEVATGDADVSASTESEGRFELDPSSSDGHLFLAQAAGYAPIQPRPIHMPAQGDLDLGDVVLSAGAILSGHVFDSVGNPVAGARLMNAINGENGFVPSELLMMGARKPLSVTDTDGSFRIESLACGAWKILIHSEAYPSKTVEGVADVPGAEVGGLRFQLDETASISGRIIGIPADGAGGLLVRARPVSSERGFEFGFGGRGMRQVECSADGDFELRGLDAGITYELQAREQRSGGIAGIFGGASIRSEPVRADSGSTGVELIYNRGGSLSFEVIDDSSGKPVTNMLVSYGTQFLSPVRGDDGRVQREYPDGFVEIPGLYPRGAKKTVDLEISSTGFRDYSVKDIAFTPGEDMNLGVLRLSPAPVLVVTVTDAKSGAPVTGASVTLTEAPEDFSAGGRRVEMNLTIGEDDGPARIFGGGNRGTTDEFGVATINSLEDTDCVLRVESDGHAPFEDPHVFMPAGERVEREVTLSQGGSVVVTVFDPDGKPMRDVKVDHRDPSSGPMVMMFGSGHSSKNRTDASGRAHFSHLEPGVHSFRIADSKGPSGGFVGDGEAVVMMAGGGGSDAEPWTEVLVAEGSEEAVELEASPRGILDGRVRESGVVLAGATMTLSPRKEGSPELGGFDPHGFFGGGEKVRTDGDGFYSFEGVKPGEYTLEVSHPSRVLPTELELEIRDRGGEVRKKFDVELAVAVIEGRIEDQDGEPVANVEVWAERYTENQVQAYQMIMIDDSNEGSMSFGGGSRDGRVRTDADGFYRLRGVPVEVPLEVHANGRAFQETTSEAVTVGVDQVLTGLDLALRAAGEVDVAVANADGSSPGMCMIVAEYLGDEDVDPVREMGRGTGSTTLRGLRPGQWEISVQVFSGGGMGTPSGTQIVTVVAGEKESVSITAP